MVLNNYLRDALRAHLGLPLLEVSDFTVISGRFDGPVLRASLSSPGRFREPATFELEVEGDGWIVWDWSPSHWGADALQATFLDPPIDVILSGGGVLRFVRPCPEITPINPTGSPSPSP